MELEDRAFATGGLMGAFGAVGLGGFITAGLGSVEAPVRLVRVLSPVDDE